MKRQTWLLSRNAADDVCAAPCPSGGEDKSSAVPSAAAKSYPSTVWGSEATGMASSSEADLGGCTQGSDASLSPQHSAATPSDATPPLSSLLFASENFLRPSASRLSQQSHASTLSAPPEGPSLTAPECADASRAQRPEAGEADSVAQYLSQLITSSRTFLARPPPTATSGLNEARCRPSRPMSSNGGVKVAPRGAVSHGPTRPGSAQPTSSHAATSPSGGGAAATQCKSPVYDAAVKSGGSHEEITATLEDSESTNPATAPWNQGSSSLGHTDEESGEPMNSLPPGPLRRTTVPVIRVCVRRLVRRSTASATMATPAISSLHNQRHGHAAEPAPPMTRVTLNRHPVLLAQPRTKSNAPGGTPNSQQCRSAEAGGFSEPSSGFTDTTAPSVSKGKTRDSPLPRSMLPQPTSLSVNDLATAAATVNTIPHGELPKRRSTHPQSTFVPPVLPSPLHYSSASDSVLSGSSSRSSSCSPTNAGARDALGPQKGCGENKENQLGAGSLSPTSPSNAHAQRKGSFPLPPTPPPRQRFPDGPLCNRLSMRRPSLSSSSLKAARSAAEGLRESGNECFREGDYQNALRLYSEALRLEPSSAVIGCNRASAYLLTGQWTAALAQCCYVLLLAPGEMKAHWRAGRALVHLGRLPEARRHYRAARQAAEGAISQLSEARRGSTSGAAGSSHAHQVKWLRECKAVETEEAALDAVEKYVTFMRLGQCAEAQQQLTVCLAAFTSGGEACGPGSAPWRARMAETMTLVDPHHALEKIKALKKEYYGASHDAPAQSHTDGEEGNPNASPLASAGSGASARFLGPELDFVHAKALFLCAHDAAATSLCLRFLDDARAKLAAQQVTVQADIRLYTQWAAEVRGPGTLDADAWLRAYQVEEDSRMLELRNTITQFECYRDKGNAAYLAGQWSVAYDAYTHCLQLGSRNTSLLSTTYCNRSAVCMQANRWSEALNDASAAVKSNNKNDKAYGRRARIHLNLFQQLQQQHTQNGLHEYPAATRVVLQRHLDCAVEDLRTCVQLLSSAPSAERLGAAEQLAKAQQIRQEFVLSVHKNNFARSGPTAAAPPPPPPRARASTGGPWGRTGIPGNFFSSGNFSRSSSNRGSHYTPPPQQHGTGAVAAHLAVLGLPVNAARLDQAVLTRAYRKAALQWHPDKWVRGTEKEKLEAEKHFKEVNVAYHALQDSVCP